MNKATKLNKSKEDDVFKASLRRLRSNEDFKIVMLKINDLCKWRKDLKNDNPIVLARLCGEQHCANYLNDKLDELEREAWE